MNTKWELWMITRICTILLLGLIIACHPISKSVSSTLDVHQNLELINDSTLVSTHEVSNAQFSNFINESSNEMTVDSLNWASKEFIGYYDLYAMLYHKHPAYDDFPVVNVSYESAVAYCKWMTKKYNLNPKRKYEKVLYYLPNLNEWKSFINHPYEGDHISIFPFYWNSNSVYNKKGEKMANFKIPMEYQVEYQNEPILDCFSLSKYQNSFFHVYGNVAEMTSEKGVAIGGSWFHSPSESRSCDIQKYVTPQIWLGFRPFVRVLKYEK